MGALTTATLVLGSAAAVANATATGPVVNRGESLAPAGLPIPAGPVIVINQRSGWCLEVDNGSLAPGTGVLQWLCHRGQHQLWQVIDLHNGYVQLRVEHSDQCLEVDNASLEPGARVLQWPCHGGTHQQWKMLDPPVRATQFMARHSGKCLEVDQSGGGLELGARVLQWHCTGSTQQLWNFS